MIIATKVYMHLLLFLEKIITFFSLFVYLNKWYPYIFIHKWFAKKTDILIFIGEANYKVHQHWLQNCTQYKHNIRLCIINDCNNSKLCERIFSLSAIYKPKHVIVFFENINLIDMYTNGGTKTVDFCDIILESDNDHIVAYRKEKFYERYEGINMFLHFMFIYRFVETYCAANNINITPIIQSKIITKLPTDILKSLFSNKIYAPDKTTVSYVSELQQ
jgi:hypothetical protein